VGFTAQHVPFEGSTEATDDLIQRQVDFKYDDVPSPTALPAEAPKKIKAD
jgi:tripartite-type tricarboxylate transporter receptor subunit TctC